MRVPTLSALAVSGKLDRARIRVLPEPDGQDPPDAGRASGGDQLSRIGLAEPEMGVGVDHYSTFGTSGSMRSIVWRTMSPIGT